MKLLGNYSLHVLGYGCEKCWKKMCVTATFQENFVDRTDQETINEIDATE